MFWVNRTFLEQSSMELERTEDNWRIATKQLKSVDEDISNANELMSQVSPLAIRGRGITQN